MENIEASEGNGTIHHYEGYEENEEENEQRKILIRQLFTGKHQNLSVLSSILMKRNTMSFRSEMLLLI
jgi:hypothetical protein